MKQPERELSEEQVARAFRLLAEAHVEARQPDDESAWQALVASQSSLAGLDGAPSADRSHLALVAPRRPATWRIVGGIGVAVAAAAMAAFFFWPARGIDYEIEGGGSQVGRSVAPSANEVGLEAGELVATEDQAASIRFSEDSRIELRPHTTLRVAVEEGERVVSRLSQGELDVRVVHAEKTDFRFWAGPYEVKVVGTAFRLSFDPKAERMHISLREGRVRVTDRAGHETFVSAGQDVDFGARAAPDDGAQNDASAEKPTSESEPTTGSVEATPSVGTTAGDVGAASGESSYAQLAARGRFTEIVQAAERRGLERVWAEKSGGELKELAQAAHYTGNPNLAEKTWKRVRSRFAGQAVAASAAFFLGRMADQTGRASEAITHFDTYLREAPRGTYAAEALGRKLVLARGALGAEAAVRVARQYLARFPQGPYASHARELLRGE